MTGKRLIQQFSGYMGAIDSLPGKHVRAHLVELKEALLLLLSAVLLGDIVAEAVVPVGIGPFEDPSALHNLQGTMPQH